MMSESYLEMLNKLKESIDTDTSLPKEIKDGANSLVKELFNLLWPYSD